MTSETIILSESLAGRLLGGALRRLMPRQLHGGLDITLPSGRQIRLGHDQAGPVADLQLSSYRVLWRAMRRGAVGFGESYLAGEWESSDITALLSFYLANRRALDEAGKSIFRTSTAVRLWHRLRTNTRRGSRRNIEAHYDLGNEFYRLWLDAGLTYSAALFDSKTTTLEEAQDAKYRAVLEATETKPGAHVLEIGCGWGGFAEAAANAGRKVTAVTISQQQFSHCRKRLAGKNADVRLEDYRDIRGSFDAIASIEMVEAVGEAHWPVYFRTLHDRLKPGGAAVLQAITIGHEYYEGYRQNPDFIQRYIFPGGMLPTPEILRAQARKAGLLFEPVLRFGRDYARTLEIWRQNFESAWPAIEELGFDAAFRRRWRYYLAYCEAGFLDGAIDVGLYRFVRPPDAGA